MVQPTLKPITQSSVPKIGPKRKPDITANGEAKPNKKTQIILNNINPIENKIRLLFLKSISKLLFSLRYEKFVNWSTSKNINNVYNKAIKHKKYTEPNIIFIFFVIKILTVHKTYN